MRGRPVDAATAGAERESLLGGEDIRRNSPLDGLSRYGYEKGFVPDLRNLRRLLSPSSADEHIKSPYASVQMLPGTKMSICSWAKEKSVGLKVSRVDAPAFKAHVAITAS